MTRKVLEKTNVFTQSRARRLSIEAIRSRVSHSRSDAAERRRYKHEAVSNSRFIAIGTHLCADLINLPGEPARGLRPIQAPEFYSARCQIRRFASPDPIRLARMVNEIGS